MKQQDKNLANDNDLPAANSDDFLIENEENQQLRERDPLIEEIINPQQDKLEEKPE